MDDLRSNPVIHGILLILIGAYMAFMGYKIHDNTVKGLSNMSMQTTMTVMICMLIVGVLIIGYGVFILIRSKKNKK